MFEAHFKSAGLFKKIVDSIKDIINHANFVCTENGIEMQAMDSGHVCLVSLNLSKKGFTTYKCTETIALGINFASLAKVLKCAEASDELTLKLDSSSEDTLQIVVKSSPTKKSEFSLNLLDIDAETMTIPDADYPCIVSMSSSEFKKTIHDLSAFGESCSIMVDEGKIRFTVAGDDGKSSVEHAKNDSKKDDEELIIDISSDISQQFSVKYLSSFTKGSCLTSRMELYISNDMPLVCEYAMMGISLKYFLAPKLDGSDEE